MTAAIKSWERTRCASFLETTGVDPWLTHRPHGGLPCAHPHCVLRSSRDGSPCTESEQLNTPTVIFAGKLIARVGLATNKPAEFIILRISQDTRALEAELAAAEG